MYNKIESYHINSCSTSPYHILTQCAAYISFIKEFYKFKSLYASTQRRFQLRWGEKRACLNDKTPTTGFDRHYIYHPAWAARILAETKPAVHIDISSTLYFCSIISAFMPVNFYDYRPADLRLDKLNTSSADLLNLPFDDESIDSLSCMHVVEHVGLGRYGDPLDPDYDLKAISELKRVLAPGGNLLFVVPVGGIPKIIFNAHRIYSYEQVLDYFSDLKLMEFALIPDEQAKGGLIRNASREMADSCTYGCGCFWFKKN
jgi:SAM-dependent methyltransferase